MSNELPAEEGFYWAKWKIAKDGTDTCQHCGANNSDFEFSNIIGDEWEVVRLVENGGEIQSADYWMVEVAGVSRWQQRENFFWGERIKPYGRS